MKYRDDREALRNRAEVLESDLEAAERKLREAETRLRHHEEKDAAEQKELERLRGEVARLRPPAPRKRAASPNRIVIVGMVVVASLVVAGAVSAVLLRSGPSESYDPSPVAAPPAPVAAAAPQRRGDAIFGGVVAKSEGGPEVGTPCLLHASLKTAPQGLGVDRLTVHCGDQLIYDSSTPIGGGMQNLTGGAVELTGDGKHRYVVEYALTGAWQGERPQIQVDTQAQAARIWREGLDESSVTLHLDDFSFARRDAIATSAEPLRAGSLRRHPLSLVKKEGPAPSTDGSCELSVEPSPAKSPMSCRVVVRCGGTIFYGGKQKGFNDCAPDGTASDPKPTSEDGDPSLKLDASTVTVSEPTWSATFRLEPAPCLKNGTWRAITFAPAVKRGTLEVDESEATITWDDKSVEPLRVNCQKGEVILSDAGGAPAFTLALGPGFSTAGGTSITGEPVGLLALP